MRETLQPDHTFTSPKTTGSVSPVFLSPFLIDTLTVHRRAQAAEKLRVGITWADGVSCSQRRTVALWLHQPCATIFEGRSIEPNFEGFACTTYDTHFYHS